MSATDIKLATMMSVTDMNTSGDHADPIDGKIVAITGAGTGIGEATALRLAGRGARLVLGGRREDPLNDLARRIRQTGGDAEVLRTDVSRRVDLDALVARATDRFGRLDVLINNAGIGPISPFDALKVDEWEAMVDVNIKGLLYGIAAALPVFRAQGSGHLIATSSTAAHRIVPNQGVYAATKTAVNVICEGLRQEAGASVRVTVITPGFTDTDFSHGISDPEVRAAIAASRAAFAISPDALARAMVFAIEQPPEVDVGEVIVRPTAQS